MNTFDLLVSTPEGICFEGKVRSLFLRGAEGDFSVLSNHIPFITTVVPCDCTLILADGTKTAAATDGGILSVKKSGVVFASKNFKRQ